MRLRAPVALLALLVASGLGATIAPATAADPLAGAPTVGACYDLTLKQAYQESAPKAPVACTGRHTLLVGAVGEVPASIDWSDDEALAKASNSICDPFWKTYFDRRSPSRFLGLHQGIWLMPTPDQRAQGAAWISCEIGLSDGRRLLPIPEAGPAPGGRKLDDSVARCAAGRKFVTVPCSRPHQFRATHVFSFKATGGDKAVARVAARAAQRGCPAKMRSERWLWSYRPMPQKNSYGLICLDQTRR